ncbi:MAG TPA: EamA family transporter RarD [Pseudomonadales bacterium]
MNPVPSMRIDRAGVWFALAAYGLWGVAPVYFKLVDFAHPVEVVAHRIVWSVVVLALVIWLRKLWPTMGQLTRRQLGGLALSGLLISGNWLLFIWAIFNGRMLDASLGYFINPLVNVLLGVVFFREWLRPAQRLALAMAALGVLNEVLAVGLVPWVGLALATSFGLYGLVRKQIAVGAAVGLALETALVLPLALGYLWYAAAAGQSAFFDGSAAEVGLLVAAGPITVVPLVCFAAAAVRLPLSVLGFFQYLAPSAMLLLAVFVYGEPFRSSQLVTFGCIWTALLIFSGEALYHQKRLSRELGVKLSGEEAL